MCNIVIFFSFFIHLFILNCYFFFFGTRKGNDVCVTRFVFSICVTEYDFYLIECVRCHAIENKTKNHASDKVKKLCYCR